MSKLLFPLTYLYRFIFFLREYYLSLLGAHKLPGYVISVGNIEAGGTGKSPVVLSLAARFLQSGKTVAVLTRGYRSNLGKSEFAIVLANQVIAGKSSLLGADEARMISATLPGVYVVLGANRVRSSGELLKIRSKVDVWILDDGFQHRKLHRNKDLVIINKLGQAPYDMVFPAGLLRELPKALKRADMILYRNEPFELDRYPTQFPLSFHFGPFLDVKGATFDQQKFGHVAVATAIAHPKQFFTDLESIGINVVKLSYKRDHLNFDSDEIQKIGQEVDQIIVTEKDFWRHPQNWQASKTTVVRATQHTELPDEIWEIIGNLN